MSDFKNNFAKIFIVVLLFFSLFCLLKFAIHAEPNCDKPVFEELDYCIEKIQREIDVRKPAHEYNKKELAGLRKTLKSLENRIDALSYQLGVFETDIENREEEMAYAREILYEKVKSDYIRRRMYDPISSFFNSPDASKAFKEAVLQQMVAEGDRRTIEELAQEIAELERDRESLERNRSDLAAAQKEIDSRATFLAGEVEKVESYLASLSAKQQEFLAQKLGSLNLPTSLGAGPLYCTDDRNLNPGFSPAFAFYTFGIPHRVGMNQYGAYGRAKAGQNHETILRAYFDNINFETRPNINITVDGYGPMPVETYLLGIYEMPGDWPIEALKAQAIAARSYALAYTGNGASSICTSQKCQVYKGGNKGGAWEQAVNQTAGRVLVSGGQAIKAWYASTAGGYTFNSSDVWQTSTAWTKRMQDTTSNAGNFSDLQSRAYDKDSPCFYAAQGWRNEYDKSAWLRAEELADIVNAILLARADAGTKDHLYQPDKPHPYGGEVWDENRVKQELSSKGITPLNSASNVSISGVDWGIGRTTQVTIDGISLNGDEFKNFFNLRAPANIQIVGPLFSVERKG